MRFLLDTNVLVYALHQEAEHHGETDGFIMRCLVGGHVCYFLSSSLNDVYYILRRHYLSEGDARQSVRMLRETLDMLDLSSTLVDAALDSDEPDYEDGVVRAAAEALQVDAIVTYDKDAFARSPVRKATAGQALGFLEGACGKL